MCCCLAGEALCCAGKCACGAVTGSVSAFSSKIIYSIGFTIVSLLSLFFGSGIVARIPNVLTDSCGEECLSYFLVMKTSASMVLYHLFLFLVLLGCKMDDPRAVLHNGLWPLKVLLWIGSFVGCIFIPNQFLEKYWIASLTFSFLFLLIQVLILVDFSCSIAESWLQKYEDGNKSFKFLLIGSFLLFETLIIVATVFLFKNSGGRQRDQTLIAINLIFNLIVCLIPFSSAIREVSPQLGLLQGSMISLYSTYLLYSAVHGEKFSDFNHAESDIWLRIVGLMFPLLSVTWAALHSGTVSKQAVSEEQETKDVEYNYSFFHFVFLTASFYVGTLMTDWKQSRLIDGEFHFGTGDADFWVIASTSWMTYLIYIWIAIAPLVLPNRSFE